MERMTVREILEATGGRLLCGEESAPLTGIAIDSRAAGAGSLFVPLAGEKVDAHRFIGQALENGAAASLTSEHDRAAGQKPWIRVEDTKKALQDIGAYYRRRLKLPLVGITGSVGKTTTREMVACALSARFRVYKTPGNHNSQVGVPMTLTELTDRDEIGVIELGMSEPGELSVIARIAAVQMAVITNVGVTHIEQLGSRENIYREKLSIQDGLEPGGILFLNGDDHMLKEAAARPGCRTVYYGTGENAGYRAEDVRLEDGFPAFTAVHGNERAPVRLKVMGNHHVLNAMVSLAVAAECGIPMEEAAARLQSFTGFQGRQQICESGGITVIDDAYNASPVSMRAALEVLESMRKAKRRVAVLADMKELGPDSPKFHAEIGEYLAAHPVEILVTLGELALEIAAGASANPDIEIHTFPQMQPMTEYLKSELKSGDCVLFKGSNSMRLMEAAAQFTGQS